MSVNTLNGNLELALYDQPGESASWSNVPGDQSQAPWPVPPMPPVPPVPPVTPVPPVGFTPPVPPAPPAWDGNPGPGFGFKTPPPAGPQAAPSWGSPAPVQGQGWNPPAATNSNEQPLVTPVPQDNPPNQNGSAAQEPVVPADGDKRSRQLDILQAIERGEISVDEGMRRLGEVEA